MLESALNNRTNQERLELDMLTATRGCKIE